MDRGKSTQGRGGKSKTPQFPSDIFALGTKSSRSEQNDSKRNVPIPLGSKHTGSLPTSKLGSMGERKRDLARIETSSTSTNLIPVKKSKVSSSIAGEYWDALAIDIDPVDLVPTVIEANHDESPKVVNLLCGALKLLKSQRPRPDSVLCTSLMYLVTIHPYLFTHDTVMQSLCSLLRKDTYKSKINVASSVLAANILYEAYKETKKWSDIFVKCYLEDCLNERMWVDSDLCHNFVENILTCVNTKPLPQVETSEDNIADAVSSYNKSITNANVSPRYVYHHDQVETLVVEFVRENLNRRQALDSMTKNFLRLLTATCGLAEIRLMVIPKLDVWLQNAKLMKPAQDLLMSVCVNTTTHTQRDIEVISGLVKIRFKPKVLGGYYVACIKELIAAHEENLSTVLKHTIYNELSTSRNPNNIQVLSVMLQMEPEKTVCRLADNLIELLLNRDDYHRPLRQFLREIARAAKNDLDIVLLAKGLMRRTDLPRDFEFKDRMFAALIDLICMCCFLMVSSYIRGDLRITDKIQKNVAQIQCEAVSWLYEHALRIFRPPPHEYVASLYRVTFIDLTSDGYFKYDMWPPDTEKQKFLQLVTEVPLLQPTVIRILMIGLSKEHPLTCIDSMELVDQLVRRAAGITLYESNPMLHADNTKMIDFLFNISAYHHPDNIDLPPGFIPPRLAIANMYWKTWLVLLIYCAHNPAVFGVHCWENFPILKVFIEMTITNNFTNTNMEDDLQLLAVEKQSIIEYESHLAKSPITEQTSLLLSQLISLDPTGPLRKPPQVVIEQLKVEVPKFHLRRLLYRSREPDFLLDIIKRQEPSQSMSWLNDLVVSSEGSLNNLPVECLCGFILSSSSKQDTKYEQLLNHLQDLLHEPQSESSVALDILKYFFTRLSFPENKLQAINGLKVLLNRNRVIKYDDDDEDDDEDEDMKPQPPETQDNDWLLLKLPKIPHFSHARSIIVTSLRTACQVENDPYLVTSYLVFLAKFGIVSANLSELTDVVRDMANLIVERSTIMSAILPSLIDLSCTDSNIALDSLLNIFHLFFNKARDPKHRESLDHAEGSDLVFIRWTTGETCICNSLVVHAMVILLTYGPQSDVDQYNILMDVWFPLDYSLSPRGHPIDDSEETEGKVLIPDWLKLRMIRSRVPRLVDSALKDLEPTQLLLFIQSFGIPIASMSKLLDILDRAIVVDRNTVEMAVVDKSYMIQLVEVQHRRGATGGRVFASMLTEAPESPIREDSPSPALFSSDVEMELVKTESPDLKPVTPSKIIQLLTNEEMHLGILKKLCEEFNESKKNNEMTPFVREVLVELMNASISKSLGDKMISNMKNASIVLRMLTACNSRDVIASLYISVQNIKNDILKPRKTQGGPLLVIIEDFLKRNKLVLSQKEKGVKSQKKGELLDWLIQIEPMPINVNCTKNIETQIKNMFAMSDEKHKTYLLTLLIHHASWTSLHQCVQILLTDDKVKTCNPTIVLDFLQALNSNPKFWQGKEKTIPKHKEILFDDILNLNDHQIICVIKYITKEAELFGNDKMSSRINLCNNLSDVVISYLLKNKNQSESFKQLYIEFYLRYPYIECTEDVGNNDVVKYMNNIGTTTLDKMSHTIITALSCVELPRMKIHQLDNSIRKLASKHPILILRQLPLIENSLLGLVHLESNVLRNRNYIYLFQQILKLIILLQPHIFNKIYKTSLQSIIETYIQLFQYHGYMREVGMMLPKFIHFIQNYLSNDTECNNQTLKLNLNLLNSLQVKIKAVANANNDNDPALRETPCIKYDLLIEQLNGADPIQALQELDELSLYNAAVLDRVLVCLLCLVSHESSAVRSLVLSLITVYLKHDPSCYNIIVPTLLKALDSNNPELVSSICDRLPDIILFAQEEALPILSKLFSLNMWMNCNSLPSIVRCIQTLNLQSGC